MIEWVYEGTRRCAPLYSHGNSVVVFVITTETSRPIRVLIACNTH
jgi:desulfoferrodoxin (superoxide reductase-like protein)